MGGQRIHKRLGSLVDFFALLAFQLLRGAAFLRLGRLPFSLFLGPEYQWDRHGSGKHQNRENHRGNQALTELLRLWRS